MVTKFLTLALCLFVFSCSGYANKSSFRQEESSVGDLSFQDITKIKEFKICAEGSIGFSRLLASIYSLGLSELTISNYAALHSDHEYSIFTQLLVSNQGDSSLSSAVKLSGITKIKMVDYSYSITGIMSRRYCTIVYGE